MRYLILSQYFPPESGATPFRLAAFLKELQRNHHTVEVVTAMPHYLLGKVFPEYRSRVYAHETYHGASVHRTWIYPATGMGLPRLFNYLSFAITCLFGLIRCEKPDLLFVESPPLFLGLPGLVYSKLRKVPLIFYVADLWPDSARELGVVKNGFILRIAENLERMIYAHARYVVAPTPGILSVLELKKRVPASKLLLLPNGVDLETFMPTAPNLQLAEQLELTGKKVFLYAGNHGAAQHLETLVEAARLLQDTDVVIVFVGDGHTKRALMGRAKGYNLRNVRFVESQPIKIITDYFSLAIASIVPLRKSDLFKSARPAKVVASLACGVPVIYCGEGETAELIRSEGVGQVVEPENPEDLARALVYRAQNGSSRESEAAKARRLAVQSFGWDLIVRRWLDELSKAEFGDRFGLRRNTG